MSTLVNQLDKIDAEIRDLEKKINFKKFKKERLEQELQWEQDLEKWRI